MDAVERNGYKPIPQPAFSPDLAPSDYFLFPNLKKDIHGRHFRSNEEVMAVVEEWVGDKDPGFFSSGLMALEHRWSKCIILGGNYIKTKKRSISPRNKLGCFFIDLPSYFSYLQKKKKKSKKKPMFSTLWNRSLQVLITNSADNISICFITIFYSNKFHDTIDVDLV